MKKQPHPKPVKAWAALRRNGRIHPDFVSADKRVVTLLAAYGMVEVEISPIPAKAKKGKR